MSDVVTDLSEFLDDVYQQFVGRPERIDEIMAYLCAGLRGIRFAIPKDKWATAIQQVAHRHHIRTVLHEDPFTKRSFDKPRGYPGDAVLLDFIYGYETPKTTELGKRIFDFTTNSPACLAVRARSQILATLVDETAARVQSPRILSIGCGHLREALISNAVQEARIGEYLALDQDELSLDVVSASFPNAPVRTLHCGLRELLAANIDGCGDLDFVYAAGLYDYLQQSAARRLTAWMFKHLRPGGALLVANFMPTIQDAGYMEAFMAWNLIYRTPDELFSITSDAEPSEVAGREIFKEPNDNIVFVKVTKK